MQHNEVNCRWNGVPNCLAGMVHRDGLGIGLEYRAGFDGPQRRPRLCRQGKIQSDDLLYDEDKSDRGENTGQDGQVAIFHWLTEPLQCG
jgi:hypothetical protein